MKNATYLSNLTALRGIAALLTVVYHVEMWIGNGGGMLANQEKTSLLDRMYLMVDFFFVLSGFIMYHVYGPWFERGVSGAHFKKFTLARFARVYPLHIFSLMVMALIFWAMHRAGLPDIPPLSVENSTFSFITNLFLVHSMNLHEWFSWVHASWSISTEWWMYMIFPFLVAPMHRLTGRAQLAVALLGWAGYVAIMFWVLPLVTVPAELPFLRVDPAKMSINVSYQYGFLRCALGFIWGMTAYKAYRSDWGRAWLGRGATLAVLVVAMFLSLHFAWPDALSVAFFPGILLSAAYGSAGANRILSSPVLQKTGDWSFSIYLMHQPLILLFAAVMMLVQPPAGGPPAKPDMWQGWALCMLLVGLTLAVSAAVYRWWEVPMRRWINTRYVPK